MSADKLPLAKNFLDDRRGDHIQLQRRYTNNRCAGVSKQVTKKLGKTGNYEVGEV